MDPLQSAQIANTVNQEPPAPPQPPMVPQPVNPIEPPKQKNSSIIFILSLTTIVACLIAAFFYWQNTKLIKQIATPSPTPIATSDITANWKTYANTDGKYQYSYPNDWKNTEPCSICEGPQNGSVVNDPNSKYPDGYLNVSYFDSSYCPTEQKVVETYNWKNLVKKQITLSGENGDMLQGTLDYTDNLQHDRRNILITYNKTCYEITTWSYQNQDQEKIFSQILSSFMFLEATPSASPTATPSSSL